MGCGRKVSRVLFGVFVFVGVVWFLLVGILVNHAADETSMVTTVAPGRNMRHWNMIVEHRHGVHMDRNFHYVSRRRVPNGPDPIHNRRTVKSRQPPGRI